MKRVDWIDAAKGITIVMVVMGHVVVSYHNVGQYEDSTLFNFSHQFVYSFHMALFMMVSGMLQYLSSKRKQVLTKPNRGGGKSYLLNKIIAYLVPYVFFSVLWWSFKMIFASRVNTTLDVSDILFIFIYPISFMWFIYALLLMVVVQLLVSRWSNNKGFACLHLLVGIALCLIQPFIARTLESVAFEDMIFSDFMKKYIYFLVGYYGYRYIVRLVEGEHRTIIAVLTGILLVGINLLSFNGMMKIGMLLGIVVALCGSLFMVTLCKGIESCRILNYLGQSSLSIYVLQGLSIAATRQVLDIVYQPSIECQGWIPFIVCTAMGTIIPLFIYYISTKIWKLDFVFSPTKYIKL